MRKYIISFNYKEIGFTAKVLVKSIEGKNIISTTLINCELDFLLGKATLIFAETDEGYQLLVVKKDHSCEVLDWQMNAEFRDKTPVLPSSGFSLS